MGVFTSRLQSLAWVFVFFRAGDTCVRRSFHEARPVKGTEWFGPRERLLSLLKAILPITGATVHVSHSNDLQLISLDSVNHRIREPFYPDFAALSFEAAWHQWRGQDLGRSNLYLSNEAFSEFLDFSLLVNRRLTELALRIVIPTEGHGTIYLLPRTSSKRALTLAMTSSCGMSLVRPSSMSRTRRCNSLRHSGLNSASSSSRLSSRRLASFERSSRGKCRTLSSRISYACPVAAMGKMIVQAPRSRQRFSAG